MRDQAIGDPGGRDSLSWRVISRITMRGAEKVMSRGSLEILKFNRMVHDPTRLLILTFLYPVAKLDYLDLRRGMKVTTGNLSAQLQKLEKAGYVLIQKGFKGKYPITVCSMTKKGREALALYAEMLKQVTKVTESPSESE